MTSQKLSIHLPDRLLPTLDLQSEGHIGVSHRVAAIIDRYQAIVEQSCPAFARAEWMVILDACNGWAAWSDAGETLMTSLWAEVDDYCRISPPTQKWDIAVQAQRDVVARLRALSPAETMAVLERVERFWRRHQLPTDQAVTEAGIVPRPPNRE